MTFLSRLCLAAAVALGAVGVATTAEAYPEGSYVRSCWDIHVNGANLVARCRDGGLNGNDGQDVRMVRFTTLSNYPDCRGDIWYFRGGLHCQRGSRSGPPGGSYRAICHDINVQGTTLYATCRLPDGAYRRVSMRDYANCTGDIAMISGRFKCNR